MTGEIVKMTSNYKPQTIQESTALYYHLVENFYTIYWSGKHIIINLLLYLLLDLLLAYEPHQNSSAQGS